MWILSIYLSEFLFIYIFIIYLIYYFFNYKYSISNFNRFIGFYLALIGYNFILLIFLIFKYNSEPVILFNCFIFDNYVIISKILILFYMCIILFFFKFFYFNKIKNKFNGLNFFFFLFPLISFFIFNAISSFNLIFLFLNLEGLTLSVIVLFVMLNNKTNLESILNYFFISSISSIFFFLGFSITFLTNKNLSFIGNTDYYIDDSGNYSFLFWLGFFFIVLYFLIKLGAFPFFYWVVKLYNSINFFCLSIFLLIKFCFVLIFFRLIGFLIFPYIWESFFFIFYISCIGSIVIGCLGALNSNNIKQFFAFISLNHLGYILIGFISDNINLFYMSFLFIIFYFFNSLLFLLTYTISQSKGIYFNINFNKKKNYSFFMNFFFLFSILSISGLPPFAIFFIKLKLISELWISGNFFIAFIIIITSFISIFYYFKLLKFFRK